MTKKLFILGASLFGLMLMFLICFTSYISYYHIFVYDSNRSVVHFKTYLEILLLSGIFIVIILSAMLFLLRHQPIPFKNSLAPALHFTQAVRILVAGITGIIFLYGLLIEPHFPLHFFGRGDIREIVYCTALSIIFIGLTMIVNYIKACSFYSGNFQFITSFRKRNLNSTIKPQITYLFPLLLFARKKSVQGEQVLDATSASLNINTEEIQLLNGMSFGLHQKNAYFLAWLYDSKQDCIILAKLIFVQQKAVLVYVAQVPVNSQIKFSIENGKNQMIHWNISRKSGENYLPLCEDTSEVKNFHFIGLKIFGIADLRLPKSLIRKTTTDMKMLQGN